MKKYFIMGIALQILLIGFWIFIFFRNPSNNVIVTDNIVRTYLFTDYDKPEERNPDKENNKQYSLCVENEPYNVFLDNANFAISCIYDTYTRNFGKDLGLDFNVLENSGGVVKILISGSGVDKNDEVLLINDVIWIDTRPIWEGREATMIIQSSYDWASRLEVKNS